MIGLAPTGELLEVLCLAAHPDDVEIGVGGTLLELGNRPDVHVTIATLTGVAPRVAEAMLAAEAFAPGASSHFFDLPDGRLPAHWSEVKQTLENLSSDLRPDLIFSPSKDDAHQDHRLIAELVPTVWRDVLVMEFEIPKSDGDLRAVNSYVPVSVDNARLKVELLNRHYPSQKPREWWDDEIFLGIMRLRGVECRSQYAEGFTVRKVRVDIAAEVVR